VKVDKQSIHGRNKHHVALFRIVALSLSPLKRHYAYASANRRTTKESQAVKTNQADQPYKPSRPCDKSFIFRWCPTLSLPVWGHHLFWYLHDLAPALATGGLARVLARLHLLNQKLEGLLNVLIVSGAGFGPAALELLRECFAFLGCDLALLGAQIGLVAYNDNGDPFDSLRVEVSWS
jgi:hypothetical protein